jgi:ABC-type branched-subunit amino acid transport system permease subunit
VTDRNSVYGIAFIIIILAICLFVVILNTNHFQGTQGIQGIQGIQGTQGLNFNSSNNIFFCYCSSYL